MFSLTYQHVYKMFVCMNGVYHPFQGFVSLPYQLQKTFEFLEPASLWVLLYTLLILTEDASSRRQLLDRLQVLCSTKYPVAFKAEGVFESLHEMCVSLKHLLSFVTNPVSEFVQWILESIESVVVGKFQSLYTSVANGVVRNVVSRLEGLAEPIRELYSKLFKSPLMLLILKNVIRVWMEYSPQMLVLELLLDINTAAGDWTDDLLASIFDNVKGFFLSATGFAASASDGKNDACKSIGETPPGDFYAPKNESDEVYVGQSADTVLIECLFRVGATLLATHVPELAGADKDVIVGLARQYTAVATALDKGGMSSASKQIVSYYEMLTGGEPERARCEYLYPRAFQFVSVVAGLVGKTPVGAELRQLSALYGQYLMEKKQWKDADVRWMSTFTSEASRFAQNAALCPSTTARLAPKSWVLAGPAGFGKSKVIEWILRIMSSALEKPKTDIAYVINSMDKYQSGYVGQDVWVYDDFGQRLDSQANPSSDLELLFRLHTDAPLVLNMAGVSEKGMLGTCHMILAATNIDFREGKPEKVLKPHIQSILSPAAVRRRLDYIVIPYVKDGFIYNGKSVVDAQGKPAFLNHSPEEILQFRIMDTTDSFLAADSGEYFSLKQLVKMMGAGYLECRDYEPPKYEADADLVEAFRSQGWLDGLGSVIAGISSLKLFTTWKSDDYCECGSSGERLTHACINSRKSGLSELMRNELVYRTPPKGMEFIDLDTREKIEDQPIFACDAKLNNDYGHLFRVCQLSADEDHMCQRAEETGRDIGPCACKLDAFFMYYAPVVSHRRSAVMKAAAGITVAMGLLVAGRAVVRMRSVSKRLAAVGDWLHQFDPTQQVFVSQGPDIGERVQHNGRWYVRVASGTGYKYYAQSPEALEVSKFTFPARVQQDVPSVVSSLFAIVADTVLLGTAVVVNTRAFIVPRHVCVSMMRYERLLFIQEGRDALYLTNNSDLRPFIVTAIGSDCCIVELSYQVFPTFVFSGCRTQIGKFAPVAEVEGVAVLMRRDVLGNLHTHQVPYTNQHKAVMYTHSGSEYRLSPDEHRLVDVASETGWCGGVYVHASANVEKPIMGIHVAGSMNSGKAVMHAGFPKLHSHVFVTKETTVCSTSFSAQGGDDSLPDKTGLGLCVAYTGRKAYQANTAKERTIFFPLVAGEYDLAHLRPFRNGGELIDPFQNALVKLATSRRKDRSGQVPLFEFAKRVAKGFDPIAIRHRSWNEVTQAGDLPSVKRQTAAGEPFGGVKCVFFSDMVGPPTLNPEAVAFMDAFIACLRSSTPFAGITKIALKDEPRLVGKVDEGKTRLFNVVPIHEFLAQRLAFYDIAAAFTLRNLAYCSALGLSPCDFGHIHNFLSEAGPCRIIAADFKYMDGSFTQYHLLCVLAFWLELAREATSQVATHHHIFGDLSSMRWLIVAVFERLCNFIMLYEDILFMPQVSHPSGSFITTIVNVTMQIILWTRVLTIVSGWSVEEVRRRVRMVFLGDDSVVAIPDDMRIEGSITEEFAKCGFVVTGGDKLSDIVLEPLWSGKGVSEYEFLSRRFARTKDGAVIGLLDPSKVKRIISFCDKGKFVDNMPEQLVALFDELALFERVEGYQRKLFHDIAAELNKVTPGCYQRLRQFHTSGDIIGMKLEALRIVQSVVEAARLEAWQPQAGDSDTQEALGANSASDTTTFVENVVETDVSAMDHEELWRKGGMERETHGEGEVWSRPHIVSTFAWDGTTAEEAWLGAFPTAYFKDNFNAQAKLANYAFLTCTVCVRVVISSSAYVAGKLLLHTRPLSNVKAKSNTTATGDPCVEIDASSGKTAVIKIPFVAEKSYLLVEEFDNLTAENEFFDFCTVGLRVLSPVAQVGTTDVSVRIFAWLEDVNLHGPTYTAWTLSAQGGGDRAMVPSEGGTNKPSSVTRMIRTFGGIVADTGVLMAKTAVKTGAAALLAGLSKPCIPDNTSFYMQVPNVGGPHMYGLCPAQNLGASQLHKVTMPEGAFSIDHDEMDIARYASRPGYFRSIAWSSAVVSETTIASIRVNPGTGHYIGAPTIAFYQTPLSACAQFFRFWRGGIKYRFEAAKTRFHAGVVEILYQPGVNDYTITADRQATICYRVLWDIQESTAIEIEVPYCSAIPWSTVLRETHTAPVTANYGSPTGYLHLRVINPLITSQNLVTDSIELLVWHWAAPDIEFACPALVTTTLDPPPALKKSEKLEGKAKATIRFRPEGEGGGVFQRDETEGVQGIGPPLQMFDAVPVHPVGAVACVGEVIHNLRVLLKRFGKEERADFLVIGSLTRRWDELFALHPVAVVMASMFSFWTGGMRMHLSVETDNTQAAAAVNPTYLLYNGQKLQGMTQLMVKMAEPRVIELPYYHVVPYMKTNNLLNPGTDYFPISFKMDVTSSTYVWYSVACADDFTMGWQIGPAGQNYVDDVGAYAPPYYKL